MLRFHPSSLLGLPLEAVWQRLAERFRDVGYIRRPLSEAEASEPEWQVRFLIGSENDLAELTALLARAGYPPGIPAKRRGQRTLTLFGRHSVAAVVELWRHFPLASSSQSTS